MKKKSLLRGEQGFTLIEMTVVLAIIGLLAVFLVPNVTKANQNAKIRAADSLARQIQVGFELYFSDHNAEYPTKASVDDVTGGRTPHKNLFADPGPDPYPAGGLLSDYMNHDASGGPSMFAFTNFTNDTGYTLILEITGINTADRYFQITPTSVQRGTWDSDTSTFTPKA